jgi:hypothetical protein
MSTYHSVESDPEGDFFVSVVLPPYTTLAFNDLGTMQALGFDVINKANNEFTIYKRIHDEMPWIMANNTNQLKTFLGSRAVADKKLHLVRAAAKKIRAVLQPADRASIPNIIVPGELEHKNFQLSLTFYPSGVKAPPFVTTDWREANVRVMTTSADVAAKLDPRKDISSPCCSTCVPTTASPTPFTR